MGKLKNGEINMLEINHISKKFGEVQAVRDVSFQVEKGTTFAFLGTNGAGKSTIIYMIINLLKPDKGSIRLADDEMIGTVFQSNRLDEELTIEENLLLRAKLYGLNKLTIKRRLDELLELTSLTHKRNRKYGNCSGGEKRKVDIIRALIHQPTLLILDEPTTGLDASSREEIWSILRKLQVEQELTIFLTTHYIEEAENADYVLIMDDGKIEVEGTPNELKAKYSKIKLTLHVKNENEVIEILNKYHYSFDLVGNQISMTLQASIDAIPILKLIENWIIDFSIKEASLENVFLQITEQIKKEIKI